MTLIADQLEGGGPGRHVLTFERAWEAYKLAVAVEAIAWELPVTVEALEQGADLPQVYRTAAARTERAWRSYIIMRREQAARRAASMVRAGQFPPVAILVPRVREEA
jgi:hypothetical protein